MVDRTKSYMIYQTAPFSMTLNDPRPRFQGHVAEYLENGTTKSPLLKYL